MVNATYKTIPALIATQTPFKHGSHSARWDEGVYEVFSYSTLIFSRDIVTKEIKFNETKYSVTTSRLQNIIRKAWSI